MRKLKRHFALSIFLLLILMAFPASALAHGGDGAPVPLAGPLSWGFAGFGLLVIAGVAGVLFSGKTDPATRSAAHFESLSGFKGYVARMRLFSRNARLYMVHVVGMDVIHGTWEVVFNLYLLAVGFDVAFVGLRILVRSVSAAAMSIPAGLISDRIGRKLSFILGDSVGATTSIIAISTANPALILGAAVLAGVFGSLHGVSEPAFIAENSEDYERVHLFSVADGTRTAAAIIGSALAGLVPFVLGASDAAAIVSLYRSVAYGGVVLWFASLIPALMLRRTALPTAPSQSGSLRAIFANVRHPDRIFRLTLPSVLISLGAGFGLPLMNVFFQEGLGSTELEIGATFAAGQGFLVIAAFLAPFVAARLGKVRSIVATRLLSIPFLLALAFAPEVGGVVGSALLVAALAYIARVTSMNMAGPVHSAFSMEILDPGERGTQVGIRQALGMALSGGAGYVGAQLMDGGDFRTPFLLMAAFYLVSSLIFWSFFGGREEELSLTPQPAAG